MKTRESCLDRAAAIYAEAVRDLATRPAAESAAAAHVPGGPSVADLTDRINQRRTR